MIKRNNEKTHSTPPTEIIECNEKPSAQTETVNHPRPKNPSRFIQIKESIKKKLPGWSKKEVELNNNHPIIAGIAIGLIVLAFELFLAPLINGNPNTLPNSQEYSQDDSANKAREHIQHDTENSGESEWSTWSETPKSKKELALYEEESKTVYRWWAAQCTRCGTNNPYHGRYSSCHGCGKTLANDQGLWKSVFEYTETDQVKTETIYGRKLGKYFGDEPYWIEDNHVVTIYSYRPIDGNT